MGTLEFGGGETVKTLVIGIVDDGQPEADEQFRVTLSEPTGGALLGTNRLATATIHDSTGLETPRFGSLVVLPGQGAQLTLAAGVHRRLEPLFSLFPLEVSDDLQNWRPFTVALRTNTSAGTFVLSDSFEIPAVQRFYRMPNSHFVSPYPRPTGPYAVGRCDRWLTDPSRRNRFLVSTNSSFRVEIWYPASPQAGAWPAPFNEEALLRAEAWWSGWTDVSCHFKDHALAKAGLAPGEASFPVILLSHGHGGLRDDLLEKAGELASHGFIVIAPDHPDANVIVFPDGACVWRDKGIPYTSESGLRDRVRDFGFIMDELARWAASDPMFAGRLDLNRTAAVGFSWGGATALEFCRTELRCRATVALDSGGFATPELPEMGLQKPSLTIRESSNTDRAIFDKSGKDSIWFQLSNSTHGGIAGWAYWPAMTTAAIQDACQINRSVNAFTVWFLNQHVKGSPDPMPALTDHPRVIGFRQK